MAAIDLSNFKLPDDLVAAPLRGLDDFLLGSARFQVPQFNDGNKWANRVTANLLYYQSNYFILMGVIFLIISMMNPRDTIIGFFGVGVAACIAFYMLTKQPQVMAYKKDRQLLSVGMIILAGWLFIWCIGSVIVFLFALAFPLMITLVHASTRLRNIKNKIANKAEAAGVTKTIMGRILELIGLKQESMIRLE